jgi:hypothetical protein
VASELTLTKQIFGEDLQVLWERSNQELPMGLFYVMHHLGENGGDVSEMYKVDGNPITVRKISQQIDEGNASCS